MDIRGHGQRRAETEMIPLSERPRAALRAVFDRMAPCNPLDGPRAVDELEPVLPFSATFAG